MKKLAILTLFLSSYIARADIIDLTPGGFTDLNPPFLQFINEQFDKGNGLLYFFDEFTPDGWVSKYGVLNGGTFFTASPIEGPTDTITWDMAGSGYCCLRYVLIGGPDGSNLYQITNPDDRIGNTAITIDGHSSITSIAFYGRVKELDDQSFTLALFGIAVGCLFCARCYHRI